MSLLNKFLQHSNRIKCLTVLLICLLPNTMELTSLHQPLWLISKPSCRAKCFQSLVRNLFQHTCSHIHCGVNLFYFFYVCIINAERPISQVTKLQPYLYFNIATCFISFLWSLHVTCSLLVYVWPRERAFKGLLNHKMVTVL